jgi:hypothetical protein
MLLAATTGGISGCANRTALAQRLRSSASPDHMPAVVACWEQAFERAGFRGSYLARVDFTLAVDGTLRDVAVRSLVDRRSGEEVGETHGLRSCLHDALTETRLPSLDLGHDLPVSGYRIAFDDVSEQVREEASERAPQVLIGPRADRCMGLYGHEPPRDITVLQAELEEAKGQARAARNTDRDRWARSLQKQYDVALELTQRLRLEADQPDVTAEARRRYEDELDRARRLAEEVGASIGCDPP